jgi:hypothetical protein
LLLLNLPLSQAWQSDGAWKSLSTNFPGEHSLQVDAPWAATFPMVQGLQNAAFASETVPAEHASIVLGVSQKEPAGHGFSTPLPKRKSSR